MTEKDDFGATYNIHLANGLSSQLREEALRIFAALRATRTERDAHQGELGVPVPLCPVPVDDAGTPYMLPLPHDTHRTSEGPAEP
ncbi:hypothetical protein [Blastococcus mobilis]|uniref:Uncharacterized protein n=1 Tax=Blastococcus mobilis TaxID=1938746 RepID=A0A239ALL1_9ACTN|nr:hypothetical protein [Blastococcus mobilis]SNR96566.1 hypothetical protein SAMN06272737_1499 [Blastococcus mobilis]